MSSEVLKSSGGQHHYRGRAQQAWLDTTPPTTAAPSHSDSKLYNMPTLPDLSRHNEMQSLPSGHAAANGVKEYFPRFSYKYSTLKEAETI